MEQGKSRDTKTQLESLAEIIQTLRSENGCPWDRKQTPQTMWKCLVEEVYELLDAIERNVAEDVCEETGDVLFQLMFIVELYREKGCFELSDAISSIASKMIRRHPHVYQDMDLSSEEELFQRWDAIKKQEKRDAGRQEHTSVLDAVPTGMPALLRSFKLSEKAARYGFDWDDMAGVVQKVEEEWQEFGDALKGGNREEIESEFGDILFTLSNVARFAGIHPEAALVRSIDKFEKRFRHLERHVNAMGTSLSHLGREEIDALWETAKKVV